jgi:hypothetical protein
MLLAWLAFTGVLGVAVACSDSQVPPITPGTDDSLRDSTRHEGRLPVLPAEGHLLV